MDFIKRCFKDNSDAFSDNLKQVGFTEDSTQQFLSETVPALLNIIENSNLDKTLEILLSAHPSNLLNLINTHSMATKLNMESEQIISGLKAISPEMSRIFLLNSNEIIAATASLAWKISDESFNQDKQFLTGFDYY